MAGGQTESCDAIRTLSLDCEDLFNRITEQEDFGTFVSLFEHYQQRFLTWAAYLGVFARPGQCLDLRLRNKPDIHDIVLRALDTLGRTLTSITQARYQFTDKTDHQPGSALKETETYLLEVEETLEQLDRLATAIRRSPGCSIERKTRDLSMGVDLEPTHDLFCVVVQSLYPCADQSLQDLLSTSMFDRYVRAMLLKTRQNDLAAKYLARRTLPVVHEDHDSSETPPIGKGSTARGATGLSLLEQSGLSIGPSSLDTRAFRKRLFNLSVPDAVTNQTNSIFINQSSYPLPPRLGRKESMLCEWCAEPLKNRDLEPSRWRRHLDNDLKPYVCLAGDCRASHSYASIREWTGHMRQHRELWYQTMYLSLYWACPLCVHTSSSFQTREGLVQHMAHQHQPTVFDENQLDIIANQSQVQKERPDGECLLCGFHVVGDQRTKLQNTGTQSIGEAINNAPRTAMEDGSLSTTYASGIDKDANVHKHDHMALHVASHLQTLTFLSLRIIAMEKNVSTAQDISTKSDTVTIDSDDYQDVLSPPDPVSFSDEGLPVRSAWLPATERYTMQFLEGTVRIYPELEHCDLFDPLSPDALIPDSEAIDDMILRLSSLLDTVDQHQCLFKSIPVQIRNYNASTQMFWRCSNCYTDNSFNAGKMCHNFPCQAYFNESCNVYRVPLKR